MFLKFLKKVILGNILQEKKKNRKRKNIQKINNETGNKNKV